MRIDSKIGRGTTVRLYLPTCTDYHFLNESQPAASIPQPSGGGTVLVVDDDESVLETAKETVADLGYHVLSAHNGREALEILKGSDNVDLLFSDIVMPGGIDGIQLAEEARRLQPSLKVLLTSGYTTASLRDKHGLSAEFPILGKPYRREQLAANLHHMLHSHMAPSLLS